MRVAALSLKRSTLTLAAVAGSLACGGLELELLSQAAIVAVIANTPMWKDGRNMEVTSVGGPTEAKPSPFRSFSRTRAIFRREPRPRRGRGLSPYGNGDLQTSRSSRTSHSDCQ